MGANENGIYTAGEFFGNIDFDPNSSTQLDSSISIPTGFLSQLDSNGNYKSHFKIHYSRTSNYSLFTREMTIDQSGNVLISCSTFDTVFVNTKNQTDTLILSQMQGRFAHYIIKLNPLNQFLWAKHINTLTNSHTREIACDQDNNVYVTGELIDSLGVDVDPGPGTQMIYGDEESYIVKLDSNGNFLDVVILPLKRIQIGADKRNVFFSGQYQDSMSLVVDSQLRRYNPSGVSDFLVGKLNNGSIQWANSLNGSGLFSIYSNDGLTLDHEGALYLAGNFIDTLDITGMQNSDRLISGPKSDAFVLKIDNDGSIDWSFQFGNQFINTFYNIATDLEKNIYVTATTNGPVSMNLNSGVGKIRFPRTNNMSVIKFDSLRNYKWHKNLNITLRSPFSMNWSQTNDLTLSSYYFNSLILGDTIYGNGNSNVFICRIKDCEPIRKYDTLTLCAGDLFYNYPVAQNDSGVNYTNLHSDNGCDTLLETYLTILPSKYDTIPFNICEGDSVVFQNRIYKQSGIFTEFSTNQFGCDSNQTVVIQVDTATFGNTSASICKGDTLFLDRNAYFNPGIYVDTLVNQAGCDSIRTLNLQLDTATFGSQTISICRGDTLFIGQNAYVNPGLYNDTILNQAGCDSILTTNLGFIADNTTTLNLKLCEGDSIQINGHIYNSRGVYVDTLVSAAGCDSVLSILIERLDTSRTRNRISICDNDSIQVGTNFYKEPGIYVDTLVNSNACDSIVITELTNLAVSDSTQEFKLCKGDRITVGDSIYQQAGTFTNVFTDQRGCDSIITTIIGQINLDFQVLAGNVLKVNEEEANYQWIDCENETPLINETSQSLQYTSGGSFRVVVSNEHCSDTSDCMQVFFELEYELKIFPNPTNSNFNVILPSKGRLELYDSKASVIWKDEYFSSGLIRVETQPVEGGVYFLVFHGEEGRLTEKIVFMGNKQ